MSWRQSLILNIISRIEGCKGEDDSQRTQYMIQLRGSVHKLQDQWTPQNQKTYE